MVSSAKSRVANRLRTRFTVLFVIGMGLLLSLVQAPIFAEEKHEARGEFIGATETTYPDWFKVSFMELEGLWNVTWLKKTSKSGCNQNLMLLN